MNKIDLPYLLIQQLAFVPLRGIWGNVHLTGYFWRLYWNNASGAGVYLDGKRKELESDRLYLLSPGCNLKTWCEKDVSQLYIHFSFDGFTNNDSNLITEFPMHPEVETLARNIAVRTSFRNGLSALALTAQVISDAPDDVFTRQDDDARIDRACMFMRSHLSEQLTVESLARIFDLTPISFLRRFKKRIGCTPNHYLQSQRYSRAAELLENSDYSIDEICDQVGVNDRFHFSRMFRTRYGYPPGEYRKIYEAAGIRHQ